MASELRNMHRRLELLRYLKNAREPKEVAEIVRHLQERDHIDDTGPAGMRMIQRDLKDLSGDHDPDNDFALKSSRGDGNSWTWWVELDEIPDIDLKRMPDDMALAFALAKKHLFHVLPRTTIDALRLHFDSAQEKLLRNRTGVHRKNLERLIARVEFDQRGQSLQLAKQLDYNVLDTIYDAIASNQRLNITYHDKERVLHPAGVVIRSPKMYLIAQTDKGEMRQFLIHRITAASKSHLASRVPSNFNLRAYIADGNLDLRLDKAGKLYTFKLLLNTAGRDNVLADLQETPINATVKIKRKGQSQTEYIITLQAHWTVQLLNWILSFGSALTVLEPALARTEVAKHLEKMLANYKP